MANTKISELPIFTGDTTGVFLVMDSADLSTTYRVTKESLSSADGAVNKFAFFNSQHTVTSAQYLYSTNGGNTIGIGTSAFNQGQPERLMVDGGSSWNIATFQTSATGSYAEVNIKNFGGGPNASTDLILWNDQTTEETGYFDIGINSSNFAQADGTYAGDAYIYTTVSDLYLAANSMGSHGHVHIIGGGRWSTPQISVFNDGTVGFNTRATPTDSTIPTSGFTFEFSGSVKLDNDLGVVGNITGNTVTATSNGAGNNLKIGDDVLLGDVNRSNTLQIAGQQDPLQGYVKFGSGSASPSLGYGGSNDHVDLSCALKLNQMDPLPLATVGTLAVSGSHLYFHNGSGWNQIG